MSGQLIPEATTYTTHNKHSRRNIHAVSGIRSGSPSNRAAPDVRLRPHGHRDHLPLFCLPILVLNIVLLLSAVLLIPSVLHIHTLFTTGSVRRRNITLSSLQNDQLIGEASRNGQFTQL